MTDTELIQKAQVYANKAHQGQLRKYNKRPYIEHPTRVAIRLGTYQHVPATVVAAAYLHDVIEDCDISAEKLSENFPQETVSLVIELTNPSKKYSRLRRADRKTIDREHIKNASYWAKIIKLLDRIDNVSDLSENCNDDFIRIYADESLKLANAILIEDELVINLINELNTNISRMLNAYDHRTAKPNNNMVEQIK